MSIIFRYWRRKRAEALTLRDESVVRLQLSVQLEKRFFAVEDVEEVPLPQPVKSWNSEEVLKDVATFLGERFRCVSNRTTAGLPIGLTDFTTERYDVDRIPEADDFRSCAVSFAPLLKASVRAQYVERQAALLFRPLVEKSGLSVLEPVELGVCRALNFAGSGDSVPQFHMMTWSTAVLFAFLFQGEPLFMRSLRCPAENEQSWLQHEFQRTTDYVAQLFPELKSWGFYAGGTRAEERLAGLKTLQNTAAEIRLLKVEDCWDAELSGFVADHWLDALGLALRP